MNQINKYINNNRSYSVNNNYSANKPENTAKDASRFDEILKQSLEQEQGIKFSKHAWQRLTERNISLTVNQKDKLTDLVSKAGMKGIRDSLVVMDNMAFVVNIKSKTVVTAMCGKELGENVFTNIDGAVIA